MRVEIIPGCIACGACVSINSDVFELTDTIHVHQEYVAGNEDDCRAAAEACPVNVIKVHE
ncbi:MAG: ferredoxin [Candidatus Gastranaerophilales bacterium]|jgi:ferredoxin|nr:ferredoxin [Candidatus Gastranaerophilales bacterium]